MGGWPGMMMLWKMQGVLGQDLRPIAQKVAETQLYQWRGERQRQYNVLPKCHRVLDLEIGHPWGELTIMVSSSGRTP
eukprot:13956392-Ditylum_brightwellii.AAC.1